MKMVTIASTSWLACRRHRQPTSPTHANMIARGLNLGPRPSVITYMGPPLTSPSLFRPLYMMARVPSKNLVAMPTRALTHIQKMAPGPPTTRAIATPAMFPMPTVALIALIRAWNELICPSPEFLTLRARIAEPILLRGIAPEYTKRNSPPPMSQKNNG